MPKSNIFQALIFLVFIFFIACNCGSENSQGNDQTNEGLIEITLEQFQSEGMEIGTASTEKFEELIKINGKLMAPSGGIAQVGPGVAGSVAGIYCKPGQYVKKGQVLCSIASKEIISLQQDFAETSNRINNLRADYERAKSLYSEKVGSQKELLSIESEYKATLARHEGLRSQLRLMNIDPETTESGIINSSYSVYAPIGGYISIQNAILGKYCEPGELLFEIIDLNQMQLFLSVFEKDISKLKIGQLVYFSLQGRSDTTYEASLNSIGKSIDPESRSIQCIASLNARDTKTLVHGMYADVIIGTNQKNALAIPTTALVKSGEEYYIFILEKTEKSSYFLKPQKVVAGLEGNGFTEVQGIDSLRKVITKGVYNLPVE